MNDKKFLIKIDHGDMKWSLPELQHCGFWRVTAKGYKLIGGI